MSANRQRTPLTLVTVLAFSISSQTLAKGLPYVFIATSNKIQYLKDANTDGDFLDALEIVDYATAFPAPVVALTSRNRTLFAVSNNWVYSIQDLNSDGDALDSNEVSLFAQPSSGQTNPNFIAVKWSPLLHLLLLDSNNGLLLRLIDQNEDNDALDANEVISIANAFTQPNALAPLTDGRILVSQNLATAPLRVLEDRNHDGDFFDFAENINYVENNPVGAALVAIDNRTQRHLRPTQSDVITYHDANADGDALDADERITFATSLDQPIQMARSASVASIYVALDNLSRDLLALRDLNSDGDALDANEQVVVATNLGNINDITVVEATVSCINGDADGDGSVTLNDLSIFTRTLVGIPAPMPICPIDMNNDRNVDGRDIQPFIEAITS